MKPRPAGCPIPAALGDVGPVGPVDAKILFIGEAAGKTEALRGVPFVPEAQAGGVLERILKGLGQDRSQFRIANCLRCHPPGDWLAGAPWESSALRHCDFQLQQVLDENHPVVVPLGGTALRAVMRLPRARGKEAAKVADFHGAPTRDPQDRFWVVPTFHPSFISRGSMKLLKVSAFDIQRAIDIAEGRYEEDTPSLIIDPPIDWFEAWTAGYFAALEAGEDPWLSVDVETEGKDADEGELKPGEGAGRITAINFACSTAEGVTVPFEEPYLAVVTALLDSPGIKVFHNGPFDLKELAKAGKSVRGVLYDSMDAWHVLQPSLPKGLGFVAPFYSRSRPWKHLGNKDGVYKAMDPVMTHRVIYGVVHDLHREGLWPVFQRRMVMLDNVCFRPAEKVGLLLDRGRLQAFDDKLSARQTEIETAIQALVPESLLPLAGPLVNRPEGDNVVERVETVVVKVCESCKTDQVHSKHRCKDRELVPAVVLAEREVPRFYRRLPFNPASSVQMLSYVKHRKHKPGRAKKTKKATTDKKTLKRLVKTGDPMYPLALEHRQVAKMHGTYGAGMLSRLDSNDRVHTTYTNTPNTLRKSSAGPNFQNLANHVDLAAGFRRCVVAAPGCKLISADYSGIEAVLVGYLSGDRNYIRLAKLGIHAYLTGFLPEVNQPADLKWSDDDLRQHFMMLKEKFDPAYNRAKRCVHGCVPGDHEVLTPTGWVRIDRLQEGELVAQWCVDGKIDFVAPSRITKLDLPEEKLIELNGRGLRIRMTPWHRVPVKTSSAGKVREFTAETLPDRGRIPVGGTVTGGYVDWTPQMALSVAVQADGSLRSANTVCFHLVRGRKIERLRKLVHEAGLRIKEVPCKCHQNGLRITIQRPPWADEYGGRCGLLKFGTKNFDLEVLLRLTKAARRSFLEELLLWDGTVRSGGRRQEYLTTDKENAVAVQTVAHLTGMQGLLRTCDRSRSLGKKPLYSVSFNRRQWARLEAMTRANLPVEPRKVYCVTVPSTFFLIRWKDTISVTGNTNYGLTPHGMSDYYPDVFQTRAQAEAVQKIYHDVCPKLKPWWERLRKKAHEHHFLGGPYEFRGADNTARYWEIVNNCVHPFGYKFWFWDVIRWERRGSRWIAGLGEDAKRVVATMPQSSAMGIIQESMLRLFVPPVGHPLYQPDLHMEGGNPATFIGDVYFGQTPLRAQIHDDLTVEAPECQEVSVTGKLVAEMMRPVAQLPLPSEWGMGDYLSIGVEVKAGRNWAPWNPDTNPDGMKKVAGVESMAADVIRDEEDDEDDADVA